MAPPKKRLRKADYDGMSSGEESEDEWAQERQAMASGSAPGARSRGAPQQDSAQSGSDEEEEDGVAQFESDEGEFVESDDEEVS